MVHFFAAKYDTYIIEMQIRRLTTLRQPQKYGIFCLFVSFLHFIHTSAVSTFYFSSYFLTLCQFTQTFAQIGRTLEFFTSLHCICFLSLFSFLWHNNYNKNNNMKILFCFQYLSFSELVTNIQLFYFLFVFFHLNLAKTYTHPHTHTHTDGKRNMQRTGREIEVKSTTKHTK